jgi:hypothetical protein
MSGHDIKRVCIHTAVNDVYSSQKRRIVETMKRRRIPMRRKILAFLFASALLVATALPLFAGGGTASADNLGPCNNGTSGGTTPIAGQSGKNYAKHHIVALAKAGNLGAPPSGNAHSPGSHHGFSLCNPSGK